MIIDVRARIMPPDVIGELHNIAEGKKPFAGLPEGAQCWATAGELLAAMDEDGVEVSWVCGFAADDMGLCRDVNDYVLGACAESVGRLLPLCAVPPLHREAGDEILRCADGGAIGVGELHQDGLGWCIRDIRETWRLAAACHESSLFVMLRLADSVGLSAARRPVGKSLAEPRDLFEFARNHPELRMILSHLGGGLLAHESAVENALDLENVCYDTAAIRPAHAGGILKYAMAAAPNKILYGSGFPSLRYRDYREIIETSLGEDESSALTLGNARKFLDFPAP